MMSARSTCVAVKTAYMTSGMASGTGQSSASGAPVAGSTATLKSNKSDAPDHPASHAHSDANELDTAVDALTHVPCPLHVDPGGAK